MFCENCGTKVPDGIKFCPKCGNRIQEVSTIKRSKRASSADSLKNNWDNWSGGKKIIAIIVACCIGIFILGLIGSALSPDVNTGSSSYDSDLNDYSSSSSYDSYVSDSSSSSSSSSTSYDDDYSYYSSSSNGHDVHTHYEGEEGTDDTYGTVYDDGSIESHSSGHTKYGDYQMDSYMDSDGNIHGSANIGGQSYTF